MSKHLASLEEGSPSLDPNPGPVPEEKASTSSPPESSDSGYFLRSPTKLVSGGLGKGKEQPPKGRGRKYFISKAQSKARFDLLEGKQQTIERALRAVQPQKKGRS